MGLTLIDQPMMAIIKMAAHTVGLYVLDFYIDNCYAQDRSYFKGIPQKNHKMENVDSLLGLGLLIYYPNHNINWPILC